MSKFPVCTVCGAMLADDTLKDKHAVWHSTLVKIPDEPETTRDELIALLHAVKGWDEESAHQRADEALLEYIRDPEITRAFNEIDKWYA